MHSCHGQWDVRQIYRASKRSNHCNGEPCCLWAHTLGKNSALEHETTRGLVGKSRAAYASLNDIQFRFANSVYIQKITELGGKECEELSLTNEIRTPQTRQHLR
jgi:hypothetical protein